MIQKLAEEGAAAYWETAHPSGLRFARWMTREQAIQRAVEMRREIVEKERALADFEKWLLATWGQP